MSERRVVIITGAANGIGRASARAFATAGYRVIAWDLDVEAGSEVAAECGGEFARVDVRERGQVRDAVSQLVQRHGRVDVLINNAGILRDAQLVKVKGGELVGELSEEDFDAVIAVNLKGVYTCTQAVAPHMIARGYGRIVSASSVVGLYGNFGQSNYVAAKSAVIGMTKVWARELGRHGITANAIAPGFVSTAMVGQMPRAALEAMVKGTPVRRVGEPEEIARAYLFLADEASGFINGALLSVDGGMVVGT